MFEELQNLPEDPILGLMAAFRADPIVRTLTLKLPPTTQTGTLSDLFTALGTEIML